MSHVHQHLAEENLKVKALRDQPCHCEGELGMVLKLTNVYFTWGFAWKKANKKEDVENGLED